ncbi:MAG: hypothetical protein RLZZ261_1080 [Bacteroidota bacterium]|jgi:GNAT superfamily N-acetyltransferase
MLRLREATLVDALRLQELSRTTFVETFAASNSPEDLQAYLDDQLSLEQISTELKCPESKFALIASGSSLWAYAKINWGSAQSEARGPQAVELERLYVLGSAKGQGLGGQLMEWATDQARSMNAQELWLGVWEHNLAARSFYARYHFSEVGHHVFRLGSDDQTDLILSKPL